MFPPLYFAQLMTFLRNFSDTLISDLLCTTQPILLHFISNKRTPHWGPPKFPPPLLATPSPLSCLRCDDFCSAPPKTFSSWWASPRTRVVPVIRCVSPGSPGLAFYPHPPPPTERTWLLWWYPPDPLGLHFLQIVPRKSCETLGSLETNVSPALFSGVIARLHCRSDSCF